MQLINMFFCNVTIRPRHTQEDTIHQQRFNKALPHDIVFVHYYRSLIIEIEPLGCTCISLSITTIFSDYIIYTRLQPHYSVLPVCIINRKIELVIL